MDRFASVPLTAPDEEGRRGVGLFATLEASGDGGTKGSVTWNRAVEAKKPLPTVSKEKLPGVRNRTLVVQATLLVTALVSALTTGVVVLLLEDARSRSSLVGLHERAGMPRQAPPSASSGGAGTSSPCGASWRRCWASRSIA
jgi:hypothetical protein